MEFVRTPIGALALIVLLAAGAALGATGLEVHRQTTPGRSEVASIDFESMMIGVEEVEFEASDGVQLVGWLFAGRPDLPPIVLCHDYGSGRSAMVNTALALSRNGFTVLAFDFRGHGASGGGRSTRGIKEKRDVIGAVDYLLEVGPETQRRVGVFGSGMGAHAAVLAAADRSAIKALVLDGLYPDVGYPLVRDVYRDWSFAVSYFDFLTRGWFMVINGSGAGEQRAADVISELLGRDLLLLAPAADTLLADEMMQMYRTVPDQADADGNLVVVPVGHGKGLYADQMARYHERVASFFLSRLEG